MPTTERGLVYPDSAGHTRLWDHLQALADSVEAEFDRQPFAPVTGTDATLNTGSQTVWTTDPNPAIATFAAPASGRVKVTFTAYMVNTAASTSTGNAYGGCKISGGITRDPTSLERTAARGGQVGGTWSRTYLLTGLTPGTSYTLTSAHMCDAGGAWYSTDRTIVVEGA